jgi:cell division protein FtsN
MRPILTALMISFSLILISCGGVNKTRQKSVQEPSLPEKIQEAPESVTIEEPPIVEVEEKIVEVNNVPVNTDDYFVIIGSFRNLVNAEKYREQIIKDGFTSILLQNDAGLYRVSVKSTEDLTTARNEILRIRTQFKKYEDTWLLIRLKQK